MQLGKQIKYKNKTWKLWKEEYYPEKGFTYYFLNDIKQEISFHEIEFRRLKKEKVIK